jgi:Copper transport outer membrane protein, MctB
MFDFRYHVASLAAVFVALVIGILVGVGLSGRGFVDDAERENLTQRIADLERERDDARGVADRAAETESALDDLSQAAYEALVPGRLLDKRIAVLFVGSVDQGVSFAIGSAVRDAGGVVSRTRSLRVPVAPAEIREALTGKPAVRAYAGADDVGALGGELGRELAAGGSTPLWDALDDVLVEERAGPSSPSVDAVVVVRTARAQHAQAGRMLTAVYAALAGSGVPAVGVAPQAAAAGSIAAFARGGLSTVDSVDTSAGRLALALVLAGARPGRYGVGVDATDGVLPPIESGGGSG